MNDRRSAEQNRKKLTILLAHFVEHLDAHIDEIRQQGEIVQMDEALHNALTQALADMEKAQASLGKALSQLAAGETGPGHHHPHPAAEP